MADTRTRRAPPVACVSVPASGTRGCCGYDADPAGPCTDLMHFRLFVREDRVSEALFDTAGCWASITAGQAASRLAVGRPLRDLLAVTAEEVLVAAGGVRATDEPCARLAAHTLHQAARVAMAGRSPSRGPKACSEPPKPE